MGLVVPVVLSAHRRDAVGRPVRFVCGNVF